MWTQVVSSWDWLFGRSEPSEIEAIPPERRVWVRYHCEIGTTCRPVHVSEGVRCAVQVEDISRGGIKLVADARIEDGTVLSVELPGPTPGETFTVLASVVNVYPHLGGKWALGCIFTQELSTHDLRNFGAKRVLAAPTDQRNWERVPCALTASYQQINNLVMGRESADVLDLTPIGIGLLVTQLLETGQLLQLELMNPDGKAALTILALVSRVTASPERKWVVGCSFIQELNYQQLKGLLDRTSVR